MNYWVVIYRFAWLVLVVLIVIGLVCIFVPKFHQLDELQRTRAELRDDVQRTEERTRDLKIRQERFSSDPAYVERVAKEAGLIKPDEVVFKFTNDTAGAVNDAY